jgi:hypothetical protein
MNPMPGLAASARDELFAPLETRHTALTNYSHRNMGTPECVHRSSYSRLSH